MQVLHVSQPTTEGVARIVLDLVTDQVRRGHGVAVACPPGGGLADSVRAVGARWLPWPAGRLPGPGTAAETVRLARLVRAAQPDVVHLHSAKAMLAGRLAVRRRVPTVVMPNAWSFAAVTGPLRTATLAWERAAVRWTSALVCVCAAEREAAAAVGVRVDPTVVVPNGVDLARWTPADGEQRRRARAALGAPDTPLAVCVGRLTRQKGQDRAVAAWPTVRAQVPDAELVLVGGGPLETDLRAAAGDGVRFVGPSDRVAEWLAAADVVLLPSRWEGMALVPLEAMARARSVVAYDVVGVREQLPAGAGAIVPAGDVAALADAVAARLLRRIDADAEGQVGRSHVEAAHDLRSTTAQVHAVYASVLEPDRP